MGFLVHLVCKDLCKNPTLITHTHTLSISFFHIHTRSLSHTLSLHFFLSHTHMLSLSFFLSFFLFLSFSIPLSLRLYLSFFLINFLLLLLLFLSLSLSLFLNIHYDKMVREWNSIVAQQHANIILPEDIPVCVSKIHTCVTSATLKLLHAQMQVNQNRLATLHPILHADAALKFSLQNTSAEMPPVLALDNATVRPTANESGIPAGSDNIISIPALSVSSSHTPGDYEAPDLRKVLEGNVGFITFY